MTRSEAAAYVSISTRTLDRAREKHQLTTYLIEGTTCKLFLRHDIDEMLGAPPVNVTGMQAWMTIGQAAGYLRVSEKTISRLRGQGELKSYTGFGMSCPRFRRADLDRLLGYSATK